MSSFVEKHKGKMIDLSVIALVISAIVLVAYKVNDIYPFGDATIARGDMVQQTIPAGMYYVWDVLHGKASMFFTWNSGFGMNISGATSLGGFLSPLNLFLYLSPRDSLADFVNIFLMLKMIAIACSMYFYLRKYDVNHIVHIAGGILYAFGAAVLVHFQIMLVMDTAFLLPILMIGIDRIFDKKGCKFFIVSLALCLIVNVYMGCITLLFLFLSSGARIFWDTESREEKRRCALWLGVSVVVALCLSTVVSIPALLCVSETSRTSGGSFLDTYMTAIKSSYEGYDWKTIQRLIVNFALPCAGILFFLTHGKNRFRDRIKGNKGRFYVVLLMLVSMLVPGIELLWHGGSRALWPVRYIYVVSFVLIDLAVVLYQENKKLIGSVGKWFRKKAVIGGAAVAVLLSGWVFHGIYTTYSSHAEYLKWGDGVLCVIIEVLFLIAYWCMLRLKEDMGKGLIFVLLCAEVMFTSVICFAPNKDNTATFSPEYLEAANEVSKSIENEFEDFERIKNMDYAVNHIEYSLVLGEEAISNYWHVISPSLQPAFSALGYTINWTQLIDTGGTVFTDTLFNIKYYLSQSELPEQLYDYCQDVEGNDTDVDVLGLYKNKFSLPFVVGTDVSGISPQWEKFETQNELFAILTGSGERLIEDVSGQYKDGIFDIDVGEEQKVLYFYGTNTNPVYIVVNGEPVTIPCSYSSDNQQYPADFGNGMICLGCFQNQHVNVQFGGYIDESEIHLGLLDTAVFMRGTELVKNNGMKITSLEQKKSGVDINLENVEKQNVFLPVSYDEGWECTVNGEKIQTLGNIDGMLSVPVQKGENEITLRYVAPGRIAGAGLSVVTLLLLAAFVIVRKKREIKVEKLSNVAGCVAHIVLVAMFIAFLVILYVIPVLYCLGTILFASE